MPTDLLRIKFSKTAFLSILKSTIIRACYTSVMDIPPVPNHPRTIKFPRRSFGQKNPVKRSFQIGRGCIMMKQMTSRFAMCAWLSILKDGHLNSNTLDKVFIINGFSNWKDASVAFKKHDSSKRHRDSADKVTTLPKTIKDIGETLSTKHAENKNDNRKCLLKILSSLRFLGRQGLPIRGDGDETDRNYTRLLTLRGEDDSRMLEWLKRKNEKYTCAEVQNEMLQIMALSILRDISQNIRNSVYCSIIAGETTDVSNCEQCVLVLRHVMTILWHTKISLDYIKLIPLIRLLWQIKFKNEFL